jgi:hypothetical protein
MAAFSFRSRGYASANSSAYNRIHSSTDFGRDQNVITIGHILHSEGVERSKRLLRKCFDALAPGGTISIAEFLVNPERTGPPMGLIFAVNMLVNTDKP